MASAPPVPESLVEEAAYLARRAGSLTLKWYESTAEVTAKGDGSPVTEADRAAERLLRDSLAERYPRDSVVGEEYGNTPGYTGRTWYIDPIDGTQSFIRGVPLFATLLALEDVHGMAVGVIDLPALGKTVAAGRGVGCFLNDRAIKVSNRTTLAGSVLCVSGFDLIPEDITGRLHGSPLILRGWGDAYGYVLVAEGQIEAMFDPVVKPWDIAPMAVIIPEAGGRFTDTGGGSRIDTGTGLASNGTLHDQLLSIVTGPSDPADSVG